VVLKYQDDIRKLGNKEAAEGIIAEAAERAESA